VQQFVAMSRRPPQELLAELRAYLQHFDKTEHLGDSASIAEIQERLRVRIAEVEAELKRTIWQGTTGQD
jgi:hypothetical protein